MQSTVPCMRMQGIHFALPCPALPCPCRLHLPCSCLLNMNPLLLALPSVLAAGYSTMA